MQKLNFHISAYEAEEALALFLDLSLWHVLLSRFLVSFYGNRMLVLYIISYMDLCLGYCAFWIALLEELCCLG